MMVIATEIEYKAHYGQQHEYDVESLSESLVLGMSVAFTPDALQFLLSLLFQF